MSEQLKEWRKMVEYFAIRSDSAGMLSGELSDACDRIEILESRLAAAEAVCEAVGSVEDSLCLTDDIVDRWEAWRAIAKPEGK